ncbi:hypothetical protein [Haloactinospora alba]|uniref:hypothetical protein n=1 Tax=Haloactinospora alba TaxID=405555 RepID=UPI001153707F|nr:hypothetical protein [Haloactinospora alba]
MYPRPVTVTLAAAVQTLAGAAAAAGGLFTLYETLLGNVADTSVALPLVLLALVAAAVIGYAAWGLFRLRDWARTPVLLTQIFAVIIAYYMGTSGQYAAAAVFALVAAAGIASVLAPPTTAALFHSPRGENNGKEE